MSTKFQTLFRKPRSIRMSTFEDMSDYVTELTFWIWIIQSKVMTQRYGILLFGTPCRYVAFRRYERVWLTLWENLNFGESKITAVNEFKLFGIRPCYDVLNMYRIANIIIHVQICSTITFKGNTFNCNYWYLIDVWC